jgi:cephalosporin-C deacetylase
MMGVGEMDQICPPSSQYAAFNKITSPKTAVHYPDFGHENLPDFQDRIFEWMMEL